MPLSFIPKGSAAIGQGVDEAELLTAFYALGHPGKERPKGRSVVSTAIGKPRKIGLGFWSRTLVEFPRRGP
jgi:hypothetical protein